MKQTLALIILCAALFSCKTKPADEQATTDTTTKISYPFTPKYSLNWQKGDEKNAVIVLNCLKNMLQVMLKARQRILPIQQYL